MGIVESFRNFFGDKPKSYLKCHLCNTTLSTEAEFDMHMKTVHK
jgi:hypothetical protein